MIVELSTYFLVGLQVCEKRVLLLPRPEPLFFKKEVEPTVFSDSSSFSWFTLANRRSITVPLSIFKSRRFQNGHVGIKRNIIFERLVGALAAPVQYLCLISLKAL